MSIHEANSSENEILIKFPDSYDFNFANVLIISSRIVVKIFFSALNSSQ